MKNITKYLISFISAFSLILFASSPVRAVSFKSSDVITLPKDKPVTETILVTGSVITVDSNIDGDLFCAAKDVVINGNIKGDVLCAAQTIKINGIVDGDVRSVAQSIEVYGSVNRSLMTASQSLILGPKSVVKGDIIFGVQTVDLNGQIGRDMAGAGSVITISGSLLRNALVTGNSISIVETGKIGGNLDYYVTPEATASIGVKNVKGNIVRHEITPPENTIVSTQTVKAAQVGMIMTKIFAILSYLILGLAIVFLDKQNTETRVNKIITHPFLSGLIGFATLILFPIAFFIVMLTFVGIPLALVALLIYVIAMIIASLYAGTAYGQLVAQKLFHKEKSTLLMHMVLGVILLGIIVILPIIGWFIGFISFCLGLGAFVTSILSTKQ